MSFLDLFSKQAEIYAKYRPQYPEALFTYLATLNETLDLVWDCGTGNGQAALSLANHYQQIIATDPSEEQLKHAFQHPKISYQKVTAEAFEFQPASFDLISIANAIHWFNFDVFYPKVKQLLKPNGVVAAWAYGLPIVNEEIDEFTNMLHYKILDEFWVAPNRLVENEYRELPFPFQEITTPQFYSTKEFTLAEFVTYFHTWSAAQKYLNHYNENPIDKILPQLKAAWGNADERREVKWKIILKVGQLR
jgi:SAM-dependent methyltransferase